MWEKEQTHRLDIYKCKLIAIKIARNAEALYNLSKEMIAIYDGMDTMERARADVLYSQIMDR